MFFKIIFILATVYVVNASVITINVFDDDPDTEVATNPKNCDNRACDQLCRRLKFPGGACVNGRCKCDNFLNTEDGVSEKSLLVLENSVLQNDGLDTKVATNPRNCDYKACDQLCRRLKFPGGACVNGRCKCDNFLNTEDGVSEKSLFTLENSILQNDGPDSEVATNPRGCDNRACDQLCRRLKFPGGACVNGRCKCDNFLNTEDGVSEKSLLILENSVLQNEGPDTKIATNPRGCDNSACDQLCRRLKFPGGACVNGRCKCDNFLNTEDGVSEKSLFTLENSVLQNDSPDSKVATNPRGCDNRACDQLCRRLKFPGGACVNGRCKCDNFLNTEDDVSENSVPVSESSKNQTERNCNLRRCHLICRRLKFSGGTCVNDRCKCSNFWRTDDSSLLNDATSEEKEESNLVLSTNEEELTVPSFSACNTVNCNEMCHRLNYIGGWCRGGICQCY